MFKLSLKIIIFCHNSIIIINNSQKRIPPPPGIFWESIPWPFSYDWRIAHDYQHSRTNQRIATQEQHDSDGIGEAALYYPFQCQRLGDGDFYPVYREDITELCQLLHTSADYLLGLSEDESIPLARYTQDEKEIIYRLIRYFDTCHQTHKEK